MRSSVAGIIAIGLLVVPALAGATVFHSRSEALELAFPESDRVETRTFVLTDAQVSEIESAARSKVESKLVKLYTGMKGDQVLGYAFIDTHNVRTLPEAFMVVLTPTGEVRSLRMLAFYEPREYQPTDRWYDQFENKSTNSALRLGGDIHGIAGATLSARATTNGVRRALAYYKFLVASEA